MVDYDKDDETEMVIRILILWTDDQSCAARAFYKFNQRAFTKTKKLGTIISQLCNFII